MQGTLLGARKMHRSEEAKVEREEARRKRDAKLGELLKQSAGGELGEWAGVRNFYLVNADLKKTHSSSCSREDQQPAALASPARHRPEGLAFMVSES